ncbi:hypothetical protein [Streptomyces lushanensis]|uniref:hypothetical protein n=1 Tax=Streptomyces lushanensis TaxID=1434255 RepID=UPI000831103C|nr:hypothetical protein [Streptomyces lushanensis]
MLELILMALASVVIDIVLTVVVLAFFAVVQWFLEVQESVDESDIAFTLKQELKNGEYAVFQGIFDQSTDRLEHVRRINTKQLDSKLSQAHAQDKLVVYT